MAKKSHRIASRQAAASRERKRKKKAQAAQRHHTPAATAPVVPSAPPTEPSTEPALAPPVTSPAPMARQETPRYRYVTADLRRIAFIAGAMVVILIVLAFVLG